MRSLLHMIWLGGNPPMRNLANLHRMARLFAARLDDYDTLDDADKPYLPLFWMDAAAWRALMTEAVIPVRAALADEVPATLRAATDAALGAHARDVKWLEIRLRDQVQRMPVLLLEDMRAVLDRMWADLSDLAPHFTDMAAGEGGIAQLRAVGFCSEPSEIAARLEGISGAEVAGWINLLIDHTRTHWARHGLLCLASDLLRLQVVQLFPGAYVDVGDVAEMLPTLPTQRSAKVSESAFCGHHTVAIENDFFLCHHPSLMKAITFGAYLWSQNTLRAFASKAGFIEDTAPPQVLTRAALDFIDTRMPPCPAIDTLFAPPFTRLADYLCMAYGYHALFGDGADLQPYFEGKRLNERLIDNIGGFTGYQTFAFHLAPRSKEIWARCAQTFGMVGYAPQLGWKAYGFGTLNRLIGDARLRQNPALADYADAELQQTANRLGLTPRRLTEIADYCARVYDLAKQAYLDPSLQAIKTAEILEASRQL